MARRPDAAIFRSVLAVINTGIQSRNRAFTRADGRIIPIAPRVIPLAEWAKLAWPANHRRLFTYGYWRARGEERPSPHCRRPILGFKLTTTWWLEEDVQPLLITHQRVELPQVRSRLAEIDAYMRACAGWYRLDRLHGHKIWKRDVKGAGESRRLADDAGD